jgi:SAM-dependent methyltransferase
VSNRFPPHAQAHNWLIHWLNWRDVREHAKSLDGELLDIGCGRKPYAPLVLPHVDRYVGLEHPETLHGREFVDVWGEATNLPFEDASFDSVVAFQVLEHIEEPQVMLREAYRVLRPGGRLLVTTPFMWGIHEAPRDFYRYTRYGLAHLVGAAGFEGVEVTASAGYWATAGLRLSYYTRRLSRGPLAYVMRAVQVVIQATALLLDSLDREESDPPGYVTLARKPAA